MHLIIFYSFSQKKMFAIILLWLKTRFKHWNIKIVVFENYLSNTSSKGVFGIFIIQTSKDCLYTHILSIHSHLKKIPEFIVHLKTQKLNLKINNLILYTRFIKTPENQKNIIKKYNEFMGFLEKKSPNNKRENNVVVV